MIIDAQKLQNADGKIGYRKKHFIDKKQNHAEKEAEHKRDDLIFRKTRRQQAYSDVNAGHQQQAEIPADDGTVVKAADICDCQIVHKSRKNRESDERPRSEKFSQNNLGIMKRFGCQEFNCTGFAFFRKKPHRCRRDDEKENNACVFEHIPQGCRIIEENIAGIKPSHQRIEYNHHDVRYDRIKIRTQFFAKDDSYNMKRDRKPQGKIYFHSLHSLYMINSQPGFACTHPVYGASGVVKEWKTSSRLVVVRVISSKTHFS